MEILFEDRDIIAVVKPVGILSQRSEKGEDGLAELLSERMAKSGEKGEIHLIHRLDRDVGGVMIFAKNSAAASKLSSFVQNGDMIKRYYAVAHGMPNEKTGLMEDLLFHDSKKNKTYVTDRERKGVKKAKLQYETLKTADTRCGQLSLLKIRLYTGRTHQIRVQLANRKMPLFGDVRYGAGDKNVNIGLWSYSVSVPHPSLKKEMRFEKEPCGGVWELFGF